MLLESELIGELVGENGIDGEEEAVSHDESQNSEEDALRLRPSTHRN